MSAKMRVMLVSILITLLLVGINWIRPKQYAGYYTYEDVLLWVEFEGRQNCPNLIMPDGNTVEPVRCKRIKANILEAVYLIPDFATEYKLWGWEDCPEIQPLMFYDHQLEMKQVGCSRYDGPSLKRQPKGIGPAA